MPKLTPHQSQQLAELLRQYTEADKQYGELLPKWESVQPGKELPSSVITLEYVQQLKVAQDQVDAARAALNEIYRSLGQ